MSKYIPGNQKHLTLNDRIYIENELAKGTPFKDIAAFLCKDPTTISKEVRAHRLSDWYHKGTFYNAKNFCIHRYHCDPMRSGQKGAIEQAHTMLRMVLPKGTSFEFLTQWDVNLIVNHINSTPREILSGRTPYEVALETLGEDILKAFQLKPIEPDKVNLTPKLIRFNH